jgi:hypothetical protein
MSGAESKYATPIGACAPGANAAQYRRTITVPSGQFRRLAELGYLERVDVT